MVYVPAHLKRTHRVPSHWNMVRNVLLKVVRIQVSSIESPGNGRSTARYSGLSSLVRSDVHSTLNIKCQVNLTVFLKD